MVAHQAIGKDLQSRIGFEASYEDKEKGLFLVLEDKSFVDNAADDMKDLRIGIGDQKGTRDSHNEKKMKEITKVVNNNMPDIMFKQSEKMLVNWLKFAKM
mgnify:CR=1 FL=1